MKLIIVESPTKAKTIAKFLDKNYLVESSFGHIRDLPKSDLGVEVENNFKPKYVIPTKAKKVVSRLKELSSKSDTVILASDEDREGEAIAWHLKEALKLNDNAQRITFHEITKSAILKALETPRTINQDLVDAQQARRILDRLVGYELSPFLWKKVAKGLSAGRVQSVAVRLIVEREREIQNFKNEEYWQISALLKKEDADLLKNKKASSDNSDNQNDSSEFKADLYKINNKVVNKLTIKNETEASFIFNNLEAATYSVKKIEKKELHKNPPAPFTTSTLQQTANRLLGFSAKKTMTIAQKLYEGLPIKGKGQVGLITYMRTDAVNLSEYFLNSAREYINGSLGKEYLTASARHFKNKSKNAQEAHEAVRPTDIFCHPDSLKDVVEKDYYRLYKLIWQRALASQLPEAIFDATVVEIDAKNNSEHNYLFQASGQTMRFPGFLKIYPEKNTDSELPLLKEGEKVLCSKINKEQHFTKPPARYSDAGLVKELEKHGIGRPSTYAPTIATIIERNYINRDDDKRLKPTDIAFTVIDLLVKHFAKIVNYEFTAAMEDNLDHIALGEKKWQPIISDFYQDFHQNLTTKYEEVKRTDIVPEEKTEEICEKCQSPMIIKTGRYGKFLACSNFPECRNIKSLEKKERPQAETEKIKALEEKYAGEICEKCGKPMSVKIGRFGPFLGCSDYPKCKNIKNINDQDFPDITCPLCQQGKIVQKRSRRGVFYACNRYPDCKNAYWARPNGEKCSECGSLMIEDKNKGIICSNKECEKK
ncbi:MAG: type I DNA topoisomerase [Planctomycetes bacterium]|nr:type I DNA topoisomerase [Planctomycetota bacterium]